MTEDLKYFTFIWKIKNFSFCYNDADILSPLFYMHATNETEWKLLLCPNSYRFRDCVACYILRQTCDSAPKQLELNYELAFLAADGSILRSQKFLRMVCIKGQLDRSASLFVKRDEVFLLRKEQFIPDDTLTVRCRMWDSQESISGIGMCLAETRIDLQCISFVGAIKEFISLEQGLEEHPVGIKSCSSEFFFFSLSLYIAFDGKLAIEIIPLYCELRRFSKCKVFILDKFGNKVKCGEGEFHDDRPSYCIPLALSKEYLVNKSEYFLPNDELTIHNEIIYPGFGQQIDETEYIFDCGDTQGSISNSRSSSVHSKEQKITLKDGLASLFIDSVLCDAKLKTATETFSAHAAVLSAQSPVFKSMFATDMKEEANKCVEIDDLDADTVRQMLFFMYTDTLDGLQYESAKNLYFAANKYNVAPLRLMCSNVLKQNIMLTNCCDILFLADKHQDKDLKSAVQDYILENEEAVLFSGEWKNMEKNQPQLTLEIFHLIYMKNRS